MTTPWKPSRIWEGETVVVFGGGPSLTPELANSLRGRKSIAANYAIRRAPWADVLVALDGDWPAEFREFPGMRVTGCADDTLDANYIGHFFDVVRISEYHTIEIRNSGLAAVRLAGELGAAKIIMVGFDPDKYQNFDGYPKGNFAAYGNEPYPGLAGGLLNVIEQLTALGVEVVRA